LCLSVLGCCLRCTQMESFSESRCKLVLEESMKACHHSWSSLDLELFEEEGLNLGKHSGAPFQWANEFVQFRLHWAAKSLDLDLDVEVLDDLGSKVIFHYFQLRLFGFNNFLDALGSLSKFSDC
jgi:hypothetical protein